MNTARTSRADPRTPRARRLRREATPAERRLWAQRRLLELPGGHFRRQAPIGPYFADFAHHGLRLIIELDGGCHTTDVAIVRDAGRTRELEAQGYRVLRFWNDEVARNLEGIIDTILAAVHAVHAAHPPTPVRACRATRPSPPQAGGGRCESSRSGACPC